MWAGEKECNRIVERVWGGDDRVTTFTKVRKTLPIVANFYQPGTRTTLVMCIVTSREPRKCWKESKRMTQDAPTLPTSGKLKGMFRYGPSGKNSFGDRDQGYCGSKKATKTPTFSTRRQPNVKEKNAIFKIYNKKGAWQKNEVCNQVILNHFNA